MSDGATRNSESSYGAILKSSAVIGTSQALVIVIGLVRAKILAVLLGPAGFGLVSLYFSIVDLAASAGGLGVSSSGVRQIAESAGSNDTSRIWRTVAALRRSSIVLGLLGAALLLIMSQAIAALTFNDTEHTVGVAIVAAAVLFRIISAGQAALIQGLRRIADLASINLVSALGGAVATVALVYALGEDGIPIAIVVAAFIALLISTRYENRAARGAARVSWRETREEIKELLKLGAAFLVSALTMMITMYTVRVIVARQLGFEAAGLYSAAWAVGGMYVGLLLQSMGADFYPRLAAVANDNPQSNRLVNEQALVSILLAGPGVLFTLTFAPVLMVLLYSDTFEAAGRLLQWLCLGMMLRVVSWPLGSIIVAKSAKTLIVGTELAWAAVNVSLTWLLIRVFDINGVGIAFFAANAFHALLLYVIVRRLSGFRFSGGNVRMATGLLVIVSGVLESFVVFPMWVAMTIGTVCVLVTGIYSLSSVARLIPEEKVPQSLGALCRVVGIRFGVPHT